MYKDILISSADSNEPISLYTDIEDSEKFSFGFVLGVSDDYVLLGSINPYGFFDGYTLKSCQDIYRIEKNDNYGTRVYRLYQLHNQNHARFKLTTDFIRDMLDYSLTEHFVVSLEINESGYDDIQGFVDKIVDDIVYINQVDDDGNSDGDTVISIEDISGITCNSEKEAAIRLLTENNP